jgi:hypothetical protein
MGQLKIIKIVQKVWATLFRGANCICTYLFRQKMDWATFWAIFSTNSSGHPALADHKLQALVFLGRSLRVPSVIIVRPFLNAYICTYVHTHTHTYIQTYVCT